MLSCEYGLHASVANLLHPNTLHDDPAENLNRIRSCKVDEMSGVQSFPRQKYCFAWRGPHLLLSATCIQRNWEKAYLVVPPSGRRSLLHPSITHSHSQSRSVAPPGIRRCAKPDSQVSLGRRVPSHLTEARKHGSLRGPSANRNRASRYYDDDVPFVEAEFSGVVGMV